MLPVIDLPFTYLGKKLNVKLLIDSGSQRSYLKDLVLKSLKYPKIETNAELLVITFLSIGRKRFLKSGFSIALNNDGKNISIPFYV